MKKTEWLVVMREIIESSINEESRPILLCIIDSIEDN